MATPPHKVSLLARVDLSKPVYRGVLFKQSHGHSSFNKRFFVLYPKILVYYDSEDDFMRDVERGTLEVRLMLVVLGCGVEVLQSPMVTETPWLSAHYLISYCDCCWMFKDCLLL